MLSVSNNEGLSRIRAKLVASKALAWGVRRMALQDNDPNMARLADGIGKLVDQALADLAWEGRRRAAR